MHENELSQLLSRFESLASPSSDVVAQAKVRMLETLDRTSQAELLAEPDPGSLEPAAEIVLLAEPEPLNPPSRRRVSAWIPAAVAAVALVFFAVQIGDSTNYDPNVVVAADSVTDESAEPAEAALNGPAEPDAPFMDADLPRLIEGSFSTPALGGTTTISVDEPLWLVRHEAGVLAFAQEPLESELVIVRAERLAGETTSSSVIDYLGSNPLTAAGQITPITIDGVESRVWRGRLPSSDADSAGCGSDETCLPLLDTPTTIVLRPSVFLYDIAERPVGDGSSIIFTTTMSARDFYYQPFGPTFEALVATISFSELEAEP